MLWVSSLWVRWFTLFIHLSGHLRHAILPLWQEMAPSLQPHSRCSPQTRSRFCSNIFTTPRSPLSVWYWNGWRLGSSNGYRSRESSCWSSWYYKWHSPGRIRNRLSFCNHHQSFLTSVGWRALFWTGSGISLFAAAVRALLPESEVFLKAKEVGRARGTDTFNKTKIFIHETKAMLKKHWLLCIYAVLLMTGMCLIMPLWLWLISTVFKFRVQLPLVAHRFSLFSSKCTWLEITCVSLFTGSVPNLPPAIKRLFPAWCHCR